MKFFKGSEEPAAPADKGSIDTVIGPDVSFEGTLMAERGVCVEGLFKGRLRSKGIVLVNQRGNLQADVIADFVVVHGELTGNVKAGQQLDIGPTGRIVGDVEAATVTIAKGGMLVGHCTMSTDQILLEEIEEPAILQGLDALEPASTNNDGSRKSSPNKRKSTTIHVEDREIDDIIVPLDGDDATGDPDDESEITVLRE